VLAGFIARADDWIHFEEKWQEALNKPPSLKFFKMKECKARRGQFDGWSKVERDERLLELARIIKETAMASVFSLVRRDEFDGVYKNIFLSGPYEFVYWSLVSATLMSMRHFQVTEKVDFIFDEQLRLSDKIQAEYSTVVAGMPPTLRSLMGGRPVHGSDKKFLPLQAADLLAWHIRRWHHDDEMGKKFETPTLTMLRSIPYWGLPHSNESLISVIDNAKMRLSLETMSSYLRSDQFRKRVLKTISKLKD
jgi:hypothetical protein